MLTRTPQSRKIKALGVKMVLSGEGSDEVFGGYLYFHKAPNKVCGCVAACVCRYIDACTSAPHATCLQCIARCHRLC
jgi:hypothetical protein